MQRRTKDCFPKTAVDPDVSYDALVSNSSTNNNNAGVKISTDEALVPHGPDKDVTGGNVAPPASETVAKPEATMSRDAGEASEAEQQSAAITLTTPPSAGYSYTGVVGFRSDKILSIKSSVISHREKKLFSAYYKVKV